MIKVTEDDKHNDPTLHIFRDMDHCVEYMTRDSNITPEMIVTFKEEHFMMDDDFVEWAIWDGKMYIVDHTKSPEWTGVLVSQFPET